MLLLLRFQAIVLGQKSEAARTPGVLLGLTCDEMLQTYDGRSKRHGPRQVLFALEPPVTDFASMNGKAAEVFGTKIDRCWARS